MIKRNVSITLEKAQEWYNSGNDSLKEIALQAFNESELKFDFRKIKSLSDACSVLGLNYNEILSETCYMKSISRASAAMFNLNIIKKALNLGKELSFTKNPEDSYICYPFNPIIRRDSIYYSDELKDGKIKIVGKFKVEGETYLILGDSAIAKANLTCTSGLSAFNSKNGSSQAFSNIAFLGCASREIAEHFSRYFGTLITEAKYGDLKGFEIIRIF